jgi:hypothetical protein
MALRYKTKLPFAFRESDIQAFLSVVGAFKQKVQRKRGLPVPGSPSTKYNRSWSKPPHSTSSSPGMTVETRSSFIGGKSLFFGCPDRTASSPSETGRSHPINHPKPARFPNRCRRSKPPASAGRDWQPAAQQSDRRRPEWAFAKTRCRLSQGRKAAPQRGKPKGVGDPARLRKTRAGIVSSYAASASQRSSDLASVKASIIRPSLCFTRWRCLALVLCCSC